MIGIINQALSMGYAANQILNFIGTKIPNMMQNITQAKSRGYSDNDILKFLQGKIKVNPEQAKQQQSSMDRYLSETGHKTKEERKNDKATFLKGALGVAGTALGAYQLYKGYQGLTNIPTQPNQPPNPQTPIQNLPQPNVPQPSPMQQTPGQQIQAQIQQPNQVPMGMTSQIPPVQTTENVDQISEQKRLEALKTFNEKIKKNPLRDQIKEDFEKEYGQPDKFPLQKGQRIITPDGDFGSIEDLPGKTAKIDIDGNKKVIDSNTIIPIPENEDEILDLYERLIQKIPESLRSSMLNWVGYDPERNLLQVKFHGGDSYSYENIPEEFANTLKDAAFLAKTTGGNYYGTWEQGESSRGAGVSQLIRDLQKSYGGKGKEYSGKFKEVYSFLGLPEEKLREKLKREREKKKKRKSNP